MSHPLCAPEVGIWVSVRAIRNSAQDPPGHSVDERRTVARVIFTTAGLCAALLFLLGNPLVLRPRIWSATFVVRSLSIDAVLLLIGIGLILLRRWPTLLASLLAIYVAIDFKSTGSGLGVPLILGLLIPLILTGGFWRDLVWGDKRRDLLWTVGSLILTELFHYAAFVIKPT
jgi:hypothetical protein